MCPNTFSIITETHLSLSQTNCVFSLANAIELLELRLINTLRQMVSFWISPVEIFMTRAFKRT